MNNTEGTPETDYEPVQAAVAVREAQPVQTVTPTPELAAKVTAAQAKVEAVASLTFKAYERASTLVLTPEEIKALQAEFPDEAFKPGAAGKENLIYIEHAFLRDRLNAVLGLGQWSLIPRSRWGEDFSYQRQKNGQWETVNGTRIYVEAMLLVRGAFVAEAVGEMEYYPKNAGQNYGDAVEGAKTAALRRCCKEFGIGLQAWKKDWCEGWWQRKRNTHTSTATPKAQATPAAQAQERPPTSEREPNAYPVVDVIAVKEVHSKPDAAKPWTAFFIKFSDGFAELEAATFDRKIAELANDLANTNEKAALTVKPGRKPNTLEIVSLNRNNEPELIP